MKSRHYRKRNREKLLEGNENTIMKWGNYMHNLKKKFGGCQMFKDWKPGYKKYRKERRKAYNSRVSRYERLAYNQGFQDALHLIKEMFQMDGKSPI